MLYYGHLEMESPDCPVAWDRVPKEDFDLVMRGKGVYERLMAYSGRNVHSARGAANVILNSAYNFLFTFTDRGEELGREVQEGGTYRERTRRGIETGIADGLRALASESGAPAPA